jgi:hypothetical protein
MTPAFRARAEKFAPLRAGANYINLRRPQQHTWETAMSIVRMGMSEDGKFGDGYDATFGKRAAAAPAKPVAAAKADTAKPAKKPAPKKSTAKKK